MPEETTMIVSAARLVEHGRPIAHEKVDLGEPGQDEVVVDMAYGGVNPVDRYNALGRVSPDGPLPRTLGGEGSGILEGRPVVVRGFGLGSRRDGVWSTKAIVPARAPVDVPDGVDMKAAAAMGVAGVTAWRCVHDLAAVGPDDRVLVLGASGGVGSLVVSMAHRLSATVCGHTGNAAKQAWVTARGADHVVVSDADGLLEALQDYRPTVVFDALGGGFFGAAVEAMEPKGRLVIFGTSADGHGEVPLQQIYRKGIRVLGYGGLIEPDEVTDKALGDALAALARGEFEVVIDTVLPLGEVNTAFERLVDRSVNGKVLLDLGG
jgi:NADPH2:quinone reductase